MPLDTFFREQMDSLREFLDSPETTLRVIKHEPDITPILKKGLVKFEDDPENPHMFLYTDIAFGEHYPYFEDLLKEVEQLVEPLRDDLAAEDVDLPRPPPADADRRSYVRFESYFSGIAESLPPAAGNIALILAPESVGDRKLFFNSMKFLAGNTRSQRAKYIVFDGVNDSMLSELPEAAPKASCQEFHLKPEEIEKRVHADLDSGKLAPAERRQYVAMAGAFAAANGRTAEAEQYQQQSLQMATEADEPAESASALYNLGNNSLKEEELEEAEARYLRSAEICLEHELNPLLAMVMSNLGVAVHRQGRVDESLECFDIAKRTFKALENPPGTAYALDCKASALALEERNEEAEEAWLAALAEYDEIGNPAFDEVKDGGRKDIVEKLKRFYEDTGQQQKINELPNGDSQSS